jgi:hypothetical protein
MTFYETIIIGSRNNPYYSKKIRGFCQEIQVEDRGKAKVKAKAKVER